MMLRSMAILSLLAWACAGTAWAKGSDSRLFGAWQVVKWVKKDKEGTPPAGTQVKMIFNKDHTWRGELVHQGHQVKSEKGSWTLKGDRLVTRSKTKPKGDVVRVKFEGSTLRLTRDGQPDTLIFKRVE